MKAKPYDYVKRALDIVLSGAALIVLSPVLLVVALLVRRKLGSPMLFAQERPGKDGKIFTMYKFRTMLDVDEKKGLITDADRLTPFGKKLRSTSLDELPELWNVFIGDMSLVGPRPLRVAYLPLYSKEQSRRHNVKPGITGLAQVRGRNALTWNEKFAFDVEYADNYSFLLDIQIIFETIPALLRKDEISAAGNVTMPPFTGDED